MAGRLKGLAGAWGPMLGVLLAVGAGANARPLVTLPFQFEANRGQEHPRVPFLARMPGGSLYLTHSGATFVFQEGDIRRVAEMRFSGARPRPLIEGLESLPAKAHYLEGRDQRKWIRNVPTYAKVRYREVWPGIDVVFYGNQGRLEYDLVVAPGADPGRIALEWRGVKRVRAKAGGELIAEGEGFRLEQRKPAIYQGDAPAGQAVEGAPVVGRDGRVRFRLGKRDPAQRLVIDPILEYSHGFPGNFAGGIAVDAEGHAYITGRTSAGYQSAFPLVGGPSLPSTAKDRLFVAKLNRTGSGVVYSTYFGEPDTYRPGIAVDKEGSVYLAVMGSKFPVTTQVEGSPIQSPDSPGFFVIKLAPEGDRVIYSAYLSPVGKGKVSLALDAAGNAYVAEASDRVVAKLDHSGTRLTYRTMDSWTPASPSVAVDREGNAWVVGYTNSANYPPVTPGALQPTWGNQGQQSEWPGTDAFLVKRDTNGTVVYATYLGGSGSEVANAVAVDGEGNVYVAGLTNSPNFPQKNPLFPCPAGPAGAAFVSKLDPSGSRLLFSTCMGGNAEWSSDEANAIAVDSEGHAFVAGTATQRFPLLAAVQGGMSAWEFPYGSGYYREMFVARLDTVRPQLVYSTYLGSSRHDSATGVAVDPEGSAYVIGQKDSGIFLRVGSAPSEWNGGIMVAKIRPDGGDPPQFSGDSIVNAASQDSSRMGGICRGAITTIYGKGLTNVEGVVQADTVPLPTELAGTSVMVGGFSEPLPGSGVPAPLLSVSTVNGLEQINLIMPWGGWVAVSNRGRTGYTLANGARCNPEIFKVDGTRGLIQHAKDYSLVSPSQPARRGEALTLYASGLGAVEPPVEVGQPAPFNPLARTAEPMEVLVAGHPAQVLFSGLSPGSFHLYQVNFVVPEGAPSGDADVILRRAYSRSEASQPVKLAVE